VPYEALSAEETDGLNCSEYLRIPTMYTFIQYPVGSILPTMRALIVLRDDLSEISLK
jgi:hypothetical protein